MDTILFGQDITVFYKTARSFPDGILEAHESLHKLIPFSTQRKYFGLSRPENGGDIIYRAAVEEITPGEGGQLHCETLVLKKGTYKAIVVPDYLNDLQSIDRAFQQLLAERGLDPEGYCVEWYTSDKDVTCMIRLADQ